MTNPDRRSAVADIDQIAAEAAMKLWDSWSEAIGENKYVTTSKMEAIIQSAIEKAIMEDRRRCAEFGIRSAARARNLEPPDNEELT